jgi:hypothetical protein
MIPGRFCRIRRTTTVSHQLTFIIVLKFLLADQGWSASHEWSADSLPRVNDVGSGATHPEGLAVRIQKPNFLRRSHVRPSSTAKPLIYRSVYRSKKMAPMVNRCLSLCGSQHHTRLST